MNKKTILIMNLVLIVSTMPMGSLANAQETNQQNDVTVGVNGHRNKLIIFPKYALDAYGLSTQSQEGYGVGGKFKLDPFAAVSADADILYKNAGWNHLNAGLITFLNADAILEGSANARSIEQSLQLDQGSIKFGELSLAQIITASTVAGSINNQSFASAAVGSAKLGTVCAVAESDKTLDYHAIGTDIFYLDYDLAGIISFGRGGALIGKANFDVGRRIASGQFEGESLKSQSRLNWGLEAGYQFEDGGVGLSCSYQSESTGPMTTQSVTAKLDMPKSGFGTYVSYVDRSSDTAGTNQVRVGVTLTK